jgi:mannose-6-phosphate isomerase
MSASPSPAGGEAGRAAQAMIARPRLLRLKGAVQHYAWGGYQFIPELARIDNTRREPCAELWIGAHPVASATTELDGVEVPLSTLLELAPEAIVGPILAKRFGAALPYLLKVLDVRAMLSIQAHPDRQQAEDGFARENAAKVPLTAPQRNYRDPNHKPEANVALTDFWILHGFKPPDEIADLFDQVPELHPLMSDFRARLRHLGGDKVEHRRLLKALYERLMSLPQADIDSMVDPLIARVTAAYESGSLDRASADFWAARASWQFPLRDGHHDRGIVSIYLLNLVRLAPGEGTFIPAGVLHAYLEGTAVEIMASSDNVLRGGLTGKHVDVPELLKILTFESGRPTLLESSQESDDERVYDTPAEEFMLSRLDLTAGRRYERPPVAGADVLLVVEGEATVDGAGDTMTLGRGGIVLVPNGQACTIRTGSRAVLFRASVPRLPSRAAPAASSIGRP